MNKMISQKDYKQMKKKSNNYNTYLFLKNLSDKDKFNDTTDSQGGSDKNLYFVTVIKKQGLDVYMRRINGNTWEVNHIEKQ